MAAFAIFVANEILSSIITIFYRYITVHIIIKVHISSHFAFAFYLFILEQYYDV